MRVFVVSPYRGDVEKNKKYALECVFDSTMRGESAFAGHLFYTQFLDDGDPSQRSAGMEAGRDWMKSADLVAVYVDLGTSSGMAGDISCAESFNIPVVYRKLPEVDLKRALS